MRIVKATLGADAGGTVAVKIIARDRLILALDLPSAAEAERLPPADAERVCAATARVIPGSDRTTPMS